MGEAHRVEVRSWNPGATAHTICRCRLIISGPPDVVEQRMQEHIRRGNDGRDKVET